MLIGHQKIWQYLIKSAKDDKLSHAYLLSGQEKLGKKTLAVEFAKHFFKEDVTKRQHPDFILIAPQKPSSAKATTGKEEIQIAQVRECIWKLSLKPSAAPFKVAVIDEAHCLNQEAQNSLLKTLEEPKGKTLIFLVSEYPERLLSTILSRCQMLKFRPVPEKEIEDYLKNQKVSAADISKIIKNSEGRPGRAVDFLFDPQKLKTQERMALDLQKIMNSDLPFRFQAAKTIAAEPENLKDILDVWLRHFRNVLISGEAGDKCSLQKIGSIVRMLERTNFLISTTNVNPRLALEMLMLEF
jgi:DNA polymerase-3 subunit delta'